MVPLVTLAVLFLQAEPPARPAGGDTAAYWQQDVRSVIRASLDEPSGVLTGFSLVSYRNNSPDSLTEIFFHLDLNAFRSGSKWMEAELREGIRRFADLPEPYYAYQRLGRVTIDGAAARPGYPGAPDSTIVRFALPRPIAPGDSASISLAWEARLSVIPRRQGRQGRRFDFAYWYPKVCVYDRYGWQAHPLFLAGESYGEFGTFDVTLDLAADQVVAATGVLVEGDPGWEGARATPETPVTTQADWYAPRGAPAALTAGAARGRKRVRFYAERVHHFAWSINPDYVYEEGRYGSTVIRLLSLPEDRTTWGGGRAVAYTARALAWLDTIFGVYAWPQATVVHRIEGGATEFPMMVMSGGAGESTVFHEIGHLYTYGILGNNEWKEAWLDEGFTTFQTAWDFRRRGMGVPSESTQALVLGFDLDGWSEAVSTPGELFPELAIYNRMTYTKGQLFLEMLRYVVGEDTFRRALREYYAQWQLKHVSEETLRRVLEEVSRQDLGWFFGQWLHAMPLVDYRLRGVRRRREGEEWVTRIEIERLGDGVMPVDIAVPQRDTTLMVRSRGISRRDTIEVRTAQRPGRIELDPARQTMDWNYLNNLEALSFPLLGTHATGRLEHHLGWSGSAPARRDRLVVNWMPLAWYSDAGGVTVGIQSRQNYMGRFEQNVSQLAWRTGQGGDGSVGSAGLLRPDFYFAARNPVRSRAPRREVTLEAWKLDGRVGARAAAAWDRSRHFSYGPRDSAALALTFMGVEQAAFLDSLRWTDANTVELTASLGRTRAYARGTASFRLSGTLGGAWSSPRRGLAPGARAIDVQPYVRGWLENRTRRQWGPLEYRARVYLVGVAGRGAVPRQRQAFVAAADPYETFANPFLRSAGALFARDEVHHHAPGGGNVRGFSPNVTSRLMLAVSHELALPVLRRPGRRFLNGASVAVFYDLAAADSTRLGSTSITSRISSAGVGIRASHRLGPTSFVTRLDFPLVVSPAEAALGARAGDRPTRLRWIWSFEEAF